MTRNRVRSIAKITRPGFSGVCLRKRLFARIDKALVRPLVWICAPPGAGKTILASSYIETRKLECLWYQADAGDADLATFFYYLSRGATATGSKGPSLPLFTPEYAHGAAVFSKRFFEGLFAWMKPSACLVIDNYHEVSSVAAFHDAVREGLSSVPRGMNVIILSRSGPPPSFAKLLSSGSIEVIGPEELKVTPEEAKCIAELKLGRRWSGKTAEAIFNKAGGWAAGLAIILEEERSGGNGLEARDVKDRLFDYFAAEFFNRMDERTRSLLLKTSLLREFDAPTAGRIAGIKEAGEVLSALYKDNYFTERRLTGRPVYQYHPLFREFLRAELEKAYGDDGLKRLRVRAASVLDELGHSEEAAELLLLASEWDSLARIIKSSAPSLMGQGRYKLLGGWLSSFPEKKLREDPWLLLWSGASVLPADPPAARRRLSEAHALFKGLGDPAGIYMAWAAIADTYFYEWKDFRGLDGWIRELEETRLKFPAYPSKEIEERVVSAMFGSLVFRQPQNARLPLWEKEAMEVLFRPERGAGAALIGNNLVFYYLWAGRYAKARVVIDRLSGAFEAGVPDLAVIMWCIVNALYNFHVSSFEEALRWVDRGLALSETSGIPLMKAKLFGLGSMSSSMANRDMKETERYSAGMKAAMDLSSSFDLTYYHQQASRIALAKGEAAAAIEHMRVASRYADATGSPFLIGMAEAVFSYCLIEAGEREEAKKRLLKIAIIARQTKSFLLEYIRLMNEGLLILKSGDARACRTRLAKALALARKHDLRFLTLNLPESSAKLLAEAVKSGMEPAFTASVIKANSLVCPDPEIENWPFQLKVRTLGPFEVRRGEELIEFTKKAQQKPFDLLKAVIALGSVSICERAITDMLWPEAEGDAAHSAFATTLHRLRQLIGQDNLLQLRDGRLTLDVKRCWVDAWALEASLKRAKERLKSGSAGRAAEELDHALDLYRGDFLSSDHNAWSAKAREKIKEGVCKTILEVAEALARTGDPGRAAEYLQAGLAIDECSERLCSRLIEIHARGGRAREAAAAYEKLKVSLAANFGVEPSPATKSIARRLFKNHSNL